jgi:hypothetical protein
MRRAALARSIMLTFPLLASFASFASFAHADVPPPSDYVEQCTPAIQCKDGRVCGTFHGEANVDCAKAAAEAGMEQRCTSWGATVGSAVFCPKGSPAPEPPKAAPAKKGCGGCVTASAAANGDGLLVAALASLLIGAAVARRARRR